jgi:hypothetical protein
MRRLALAVLLASTLTGCAINTGIAGGMYVTPELAADCARQCTILSMRLAAVVVVHTTGGCVCEPNDRAADTRRGGAAVAGGAAVQLVEARAAGAAGVGGAAAVGTAHH